VVVLSVVVEPECLANRTSNSNNSPRQVFLGNLNQLLPPLASVRLVSSILYNPSLSTLITLLQVITLPTANKSRYLGSPPSPQPNLLKEVLVCLANNSRTSRVNSLSRNNPQSSEAEVAICLVITTSSNSNSNSNKISNQLIRVRPSSLPLLVILTDEIIPQYLAIRLLNPLGPAYSATVYSIATSNHRTSNNQRSRTILAYSAPTNQPLPPRNLAFSRTLLNRKTGTTPHHSKVSLAILSVNQGISNLDCLANLLPL